MPNIAYSVNQKKKRISSAVSILSIFLILLADQLSKAAISSRLSEGQSIPIIRDALHITFVKNTGLLLEHPRFLWNSKKSGRKIYYPLAKILPIF